MTLLLPGVGDWRWKGIRGRLTPNPPPKVMDFCTGLPILKDMEKRVNAPTPPRRVQNTPKRREGQKLCRAALWGLFTGMLLDLT
jgi:hypothetical protein